MEIWRDVYLQSTKDFNGVIKEPLQGYDRSTYRDSNRKTSGEETNKPNVPHSLQLKQLSDGEIAKWILKIELFMMVKSLPATHSWLCCYRDETTTYAGLEMTVPTAPAV